MDRFRLFCVLLVGSLIVGLSPEGHLGTTVCGQGIDAKITPAGGTPFTATLIEIGPEGIKTNSAAGTKTWPLSEVGKVERPQPSAGGSPTASVGIDGGSRLSVDGVMLDAETATLSLRNQEPLKIPIQKIDWIRFRAPSPAVDADWLGLIGKAQKEDLMVIRRSPTSIDQAPGIVVGIDAEKVTFELGGSAIPAPVAKLEGIVFANRVPTEPKGTTVIDIYGSRWAVESMLPAQAQDSLTFSLTGGIQRTLSFDELNTIQFADGAIWLSDLAPADDQYTPLVTSRLDPALLRDWLGPQIVDSRDYLLRSRSSITFRVEPETARFTALVGPESTVEAGGGSVVRIKLDNETAWEQVVTPGDNVRGLDLDISSVGRVTLEVDFGSDEHRGDAGDTIRFIGPRFLK